MVFTNFGVNLQLCFNNAHMRVEKYKHIETERDTKRWNERVTERPREKGSKRQTETRQLKVRVCEIHKRPSE